MACVFAAEVAIKESERFNGIPRVETPVAEPIKHGERILNEAIEESKKVMVQNAQWLLTTSLKVATEN